MAGSRRSWPRPTRASIWSIAALVNLASYFDSQQMDTLSRREEEALLKATKAKALKECDSVVKGESA